MHFWHFEMLNGKYIFRTLWYVIVHVSVILVLCGTLWCFGCDVESEERMVEDSL